MKCSLCDSDLVCDSLASCWCFDYPAILPVQKSNGCMCKSCLSHEVKKKIDAFVIDFKKGKIQNVALKYNGGKLIEGIDYYLEDGLWVFTEWYHLKRNKCCGSECRHCPY